MIGVIYAAPLLHSDVRSAFQSLTWPEPPVAWLKAGLIICLCIFVDVAIELAVKRPLIDILPDISTFHYPRIESKSLAWFDLLFGLILVSGRRSMFLG